MPTPRIRPGAAVIDGKIRVVGGMTPAGEPVDSHRLSPAQAQTLINAANGLIASLGP